MIRKYLRKRVQKVLSDDVQLKQFVSKVLGRRSIPTGEEHLPIVLVYSMNEPAEKFDTAPKSYKRYFEYVIEVISTHDDDAQLEDELDDLSYMVSKAIENDPVLRGWAPYHKNGYKVEETFATNTQYDQQGEGSNPIGSVRMSFQTVYVEDPAEKDALNDLKLVEFEWKIGDHGDNKAVDQVSLNT